MKSNKQTTLDNLKQAYKENSNLTLGRFSLQAYNDLKRRYNEEPAERWERLSPEVVKRFDHLRSLLIRAEQIERQHDLNKVKESENIAIKIERHRYAPELNKAHYIRVVNKTAVPLQTIPAPQCITIDEALNKLTGTQLKNLCLYV